MNTQVGQLQLRGYQVAAMNAIVSSFRTLVPSIGIVAVQPTGSGKTILIAESSRIARGRVLLLAHNSELLVQAQDKIRLHAPWIDTGIFCAGLREKDPTRKITIASVQSIDAHIEAIVSQDPFSLIIIDEAHRLNPKGEGRYVRIVEACRSANPAVRLLGLTATPYRLGHGMIIDDSRLFHRIVADAKVPELVGLGYLCPVVTRIAQSEVDTSKLKRSGDFIAAEMQALFGADGVVQAAVAEMVALASDRRHVIVFAAGVEHAYRINQLLEEHGQASAVVVGDTSISERREIYDAFQSGDVKFLVNVNCLCEGFDVQRVDAVVLMRATVSPGLYAQMTGRGFRVHESKKNCLLLDYGENVKRHGLPSDVRPPRAKGVNTKGDAPIKVCPDCQFVMHAAARECTECGHRFPLVDHARHKSSADVELSGKKKVKSIKVGRVEYQRYLTSRGSYTFKVAFYDEYGRFLAVDFYPLDHEAAEKICRKNWESRFPGVEMPTSIDDAVCIASGGRLRVPKSIATKKVLKQGKTYTEIVRRNY